MVARFLSLPLRRAGETSAPAPATIPAGSAGATPTDMPHETGLIATLAAAFGLAFVLGLAATRLRLPPIVGYGRVGSTIGEALARRGVPHVVVERDRALVDALRTRGVPAVYRDAARPAILDHAHLETARLLVVAAPDPYHARRVVALALKANPNIDTVVRTHSGAEQGYLQRVGVGRAVMGEREMAYGIAHNALVRMGRSDDEADSTIEAIRHGQAREPALQEAGGLAGAAHP